MKKASFIKYSLFLTLILFFVQPNSYAQNAIVGTGFSNGWGGSSCPTGNGNFKYLGPSAGSSYILVTNASGTGIRYFRFGVDWSGTTGQFTITPGTGNDIAVAPNTAYNLNTTCTTAGSMTINAPNTTDYYVFKTLNAGTNPTGRFVYFKIEGDIRKIVDVTRNIENPCIGNEVIVTAEIDEAFNTGQAIYLRYSTNSFATSSVIQMNGSGTTYKATIPASANTAGANVEYYVFTSGTSGVLNDGSNADFFTINLNYGGNYKYTVSNETIPNYSASYNSNFICSDANWGFTISEITGITVDNAGVKEYRIIALNHTNNITKIYSDIPNPPMDLYDLRDESTTNENWENTSNSVGTVKYTWQSRSATTGCESNHFDIITEIKPRVTGSLSGGSPSSVCSGSNSTLTLTPGGAGPWSGTIIDNVGNTIETFTNINTNPIILPITPAYSSGAFTSNNYTISYLEGDGCAADGQYLTSNAVVNVYPALTANAGSNQLLCGGTTYTTSGSVNGGGGSSNYTITWSTSGTGSFQNPNALSTVYTPSSADETAGSVTLTLTATPNSGPCTASSSSLTLTLNSDPVSYNGSCFPNIVSAISAAGAGGTIKVLKNLSIPESYNVPNNVILEFTCNVNYTVSPGQVIINNGVIKACNNFINNGTIKGSGSFEGNISNFGTMKPGDN